MATDPEDLTVDQLLDKGLVQYALGLQDEAQALWQRALALEPGNERAQDYIRTVDAVDDASASPFEGDAQRTDAMPALPNEGLQPVADDDGDGDDGADSLVPPFAPEVSFEGEESISTDDLDVEPVVPDVEIMLRDAREAEAAGKLEEALKSADDALKRDPEREETQELVASLRGRLREQYLDELHPLDRVPVLRATDASILELSLDPIGGFLISQIDGEITIEELLTILGTFDEFRVLGSLHYFLQQGIIELR